MTDRIEIRKWMEMLAHSQGFYGRMLERIDDMDPDDEDEFWQTLEANDFKDIVEFEIYMEARG